MDEADLANASEQFHRSMQIRQIRAAANPSPVSLPYCIHCGEEIPEARRKIEPGCTMCVACKQETERRLP